ncbi:MAG: hypothetical protein PHH48_05445 [Eubacteriales bacterium]|nr:hypothetical protein [Eubacteriales bacterium]
MKIIAKPIDVIVAFRHGKKPMPYKFKYLDEYSMYNEIKIDKIISIEDSRLAGINAIVYTCQSEIKGCLKIYQLKFIISEYRWQLYKI